MTRYNVVQGLGQAKPQYHVAGTYLSRRLASVSRSDKKFNQVETDAEWVRCFNSTLNACIKYLEGKRFRHCSRTFSHA